MGLQREIEELYRRVLSTDFERIARLAIPSTHAIPTTPPKGLFYTAQEPRISSPLLLAEKDFMVKRLVLDPLDIGDLHKVVERRVRRGDGNGEHFANFKKNVEGGLKTQGQAFHDFCDEVRWDATPLTTRKLDIGCHSNGQAAVHLQLVIRWAGVDYVRADGPLNPAAPQGMVSPARWTLASDNDGVEMPHGACIDGWPEIIELPLLAGEEGAAPDNKRYFVRADIAAIGKAPPP